MVFLTCTAFFWTSFSSLSINSSKGIFGKSLWAQCSSLPIMSRKSSFCKGRGGNYGKIQPFWQRVQKRSSFPPLNFARARRCQIYLTSIDIGKISGCEGSTNIFNGFYSPNTIRIIHTLSTHPRILTNGEINSIHMHRCQQ